MAKGHDGGIRQKKEDEIDAPTNYESYHSQLLRQSKKKTRGERLNGSFAALDSPFIYCITCNAMF